MSNRALQRKHRVGYRTVTAALNSAWPGPRKAPPKRGSRLDPYRAIIDGWLRGDLDAPRKQRHTAKRIFDRLLDEHQRRPPQHPRRTAAPPVTSAAPAGRTDGIIAASRRKAETAEKAARAAIAKLRRSGVPITVAAVAREAGVSQHYLHQHPDLGPLIRDLRDAARPSMKPSVIDATQSGMVGVLRSRIDAQNVERRRLLAENASLRSELETLRGALAALQRSE